MAPPLSIIGITTAGFLEKLSVRGSESVIFKHKYIKNPAFAPADAIVQAAKKLTSALRGNIPPPFLASGIDHLRALTNISSEAKGKYEKRENQKHNMNSPSIYKGRKNMRVAKAIVDELPEIW